MNDSPGFPAVPAWAPPVSRKPLKLSSTRAPPVHSLRIAPAASQKLRTCFALPASIKSLRIGSSMDSNYVTERRHGKASRTGVQESTVFRDDFPRRLSATYYGFVGRISSSLIIARSDT